MVIVVGQLLMSENHQTIPDEFMQYVAFLHDVIAAYHARLSEVTSPRVADHVLASMADKEAGYLGLDKIESPTQHVENFLRKLGMKFQTSKAGEQTTTKLDCPYASVIHPRLGSAHPICPACIMVLGAERMKDRKLLVSCKLTPTGSEYTIGPQSD